MEVNSTRPSAMDCLKPCWMRRQGVGSAKVEVVCDEYNLPIDLSPLKLFGQSGDDRYGAVDKTVMKRVDALPHGLINNVPVKS